MSYDFLLLSMIVLFGFLIFLLSLYLLAREDFVFMRRNITVEQLFDIAFLTALVALFFARIVYVALHFTTAYLNPLIFFLIPYFPGLGISGAVIGSFFFLLWISKNRKIPGGHLLDVFSVSFAYGFSATLLGYCIIQLVHRQFLSGGVNGIWGIISLALSILFGSIYMKSIWRDGNMSAVIAVCVSAVVLITRSVIMLFQKPFVLDKELILLAIVLVAAGLLGIGRKFIQRSIL